MRAQSENVGDSRSDNDRSGGRHDAGDHEARRQGGAPRDRDGVRRLRRGDGTSRGRPRPSTRSTSATWTCRTPENIVEAAFRAIARRQDRLLPQRRHPAAARGAGRRRRRARTASPTRPQNVAVQPGGKPVIEKFLLTLMNPGDEVLYPNPGFPIYESQIEFLGGVAKPYGFVPGERNFLLDFDAIEAAITPRTAPAHLQQPAQPHGGREPGRGDRGAGRARPASTTCTCSRTRPTGTCATPARSRSIASLPGMPERTVILYTFSKKFAMTGWRLGGAIGPEDLIARHRHAQRQPGVVHHALHPVGRRRGAHRRPVGRAGDPARPAGAPRRRRRALNEIPGVTCYSPEGDLLPVPRRHRAHGAQGPRDYDDFRARRWSRRASASAPACTSAARSPARSDATCASPTPASAPSASRGARPAQGVGAVSGAETSAPAPAHALFAPRTSPPAPGWSTSAAGTCPSSTRRASSPSTSRRAGGAGLFDVSHMGRFVLRGPAPCRSSSTC